LGRLLHRPTPFPVPGAVLRLALGELAGELLDSRRVVPARALARGFAFAFPDLPLALADAVGADPARDASVRASGRAEE
jgi:hypothetical protein